MLTSSKGWAILWLLVNSNGACLLILYCCKSRGERGDNGGEQEAIATCFARLLPLDLAIVAQFGCGPRFFEKTVVD